jgi:hypothetical protein
MLVPHKEAMRPSAIALMTPSHPFIVPHTTVKETGDGLLDMPLLWGRTLSSAGTWGAFLPEPCDRICADILRRRLLLPF